MSMSGNKCVLIDLECFKIDTDSNPGQVAEKLHNPLNRLQSYLTVCISINKDGLNFSFRVDTDSNPGQDVKKLHNPLDRLQSY